MFLKLADALLRHGDASLLGRCKWIMHKHGRGCMFNSGFTIEKMLNALGIILLHHLDELLSGIDWVCGTKYIQNASKLIGPALEGRCQQKEMGLVHLLLCRISFVTAIDADGAHVVPELRSAMK